SIAHLNEVATIAFSEQCTLGEIASSEQRVLAKNTFKIAKDASLETISPLAAIDEFKKSTEEVSTEEVTYGDAVASQGVLHHSGNTDPSLPVARVSVSVTKAAGSKKEQPKKERPRDELWDASVQIFGYTPQTDSERGAWNRALKDLRAAHVNAPLLRRLA